MGSRTSRGIRSAGGLAKAAKRMGSPDDSGPNEQWSKDIVSDVPMHGEKIDKLLSKADVSRAVQRAMDVLDPEDAAFIKEHISSITALEFDSTTCVAGLALARSGKVMADVRRSPDSLAHVLGHEAMHVAGRLYEPMSSTMPNGKPFLSKVEYQGDPLWKQSEVFTTEYGIRVTESLAFKAIKSSNSSRLSDALSTARSELGYRKKSTYGSKGLLDASEDAETLTAYRYKGVKQMTANKDPLVQDLVKNGFAGSKTLGLELAKSVGWEG